MIRFPALRQSGRRAAMLSLLMLAAPFAAAQAQTQPPPMAPPPSPVSTMRAPTIANPQPDHPAYDDLMRAIESTVDNKVLIDNGLAAIKKMMAQDASIAAAEAASPGLLDEMMAGMRPVLERQSLRVTALYRPKMLAVMADYLTPEEATQVAGFYRSDVGRRMMGSVVANYSFDKTLATVAAEKDVSAAEVKSDIDNAVAAGMAAMDEKDLIEAGRQALSNPALLKMQRANPAIQQVRAQMENEPLTAEEEATMAAAFEAVFKRRFPE